MIWLLWLLVAFILIGLGLLIFTQGGQNLGPAVVMIGVVIILVLIVSPARSHDHSRPELDGWFKGLESRAKSPCCDGSDATRLDDVDWESKGGRYRVRIDGEWVEVPDSAVIDGPNRAGPTMVWPTWSNGMRAVRCFLPGSMT